MPPDGTLGGVAEVENPQNTKDQREQETLERLERIEALVTEWLTVPDLAEIQGVKLSEVRRQIKDGELIAVRRGPNNAPYVPAAFLVDGEPHPRLKGTFTVLRDGGMKDAEMVEWLFTSDPTLAGGASPMAAINAGRITEVRRRAMETAF